MGSSSHSHYSAPNSGPSTRGSRPLVPSRHPAGDRPSANADRRRSIWLIPSAFAHDNPDEVSVKDKVKSTKWIVVLGVTLPVLACIIGIAAWAITTDVLRLPSRNDMTRTLTPLRGSKTKPQDDLQSRSDAGVHVFTSGSNSTKSTISNVTKTKLKTTTSKFPESTSVTSPETSSPSSTPQPVPPPPTIMVVSAIPSNSNGSTLPFPTDILKKLISDGKSKKDKPAEFVVFSPVLDSGLTSMSKNIMSLRREENHQNKTIIDDDADLVAEESAKSEEISQEIPFDIEKKKIFPKIKSLSKTKDINVNSTKKKLRKQSEEKNIAQTSIERKITRPSKMEFTNSKIPEKPIFGNNGNQMPLPIPTEIKPDLTHFVQGLSKKPPLPLQNDHIKSIAAQRINSHDFQSTRVNSSPQETTPLSNPSYNVPPRDHTQIPQQQLHPPMPQTHPIQPQNSSPNQQQQNPAYESTRQHMSNGLQQSYVNSQRPPHLTNSPNYQHQPPLLNVQQPTKQLVTPQPSFPGQQHQPPSRPVQRQHFPGSPPVSSGQQTFQSQPSPLNSQHFPGIQQQQGFNGINQQQSPMAGLASNSKLIYQRPPSGPLSSFHGPMQNQQPMQPPQKPGASNTRDAVQSKLNIISQHQNSPHAQQTPFANPQPPSQISQPSYSNTNHEPQYFAPPPQNFHSQTSYGNPPPQNTFENIAQSTVNADGTHHHHHHHHHRDPQLGDGIDDLNLSNGPITNDADRLGTVGIGSSPSRGITLQIGGSGGRLTGLLPIGALGIARGILSTLLPRPALGLNSKVFLGFEVGRGGGFSIG